MAHPGYDFERRSAHTIGLPACPRKGLFRQIYGIEIAPSPSIGETGPLSAGKVFHTLMEWHYTPPRYRKEPLRSLDVEGVTAQTPEELIVWCIDHGAAPSAATQAKEGYERYLYHWKSRGLADPFADKVVGRPEPDVHHPDLREVFPWLEGWPVPVPYAAQFDLVVEDGSRFVRSVEHKFLAAMRSGIISEYRLDGQLAGQMMVWNARKDLVEKFGYMRGVTINIVFKSGRAPYLTQEDLFLPPKRLKDYSKVVAHANLTIDRKLAAYEDLPDNPEKRKKRVERIWPQLGMSRRMCQPYLGRPCDYCQICDTDRVPGSLYTMTATGLRRAQRDGLVQIEEPIMTRQEALAKTPSFEERFDV